MEVRDLSLAAALIASGHGLEQVLPAEGHAVFRFSPSQAVQATAEAYYSRQLRVDAASFGEAIRSLKAAALSTRRREVAGSGEKGARA